MGALLQLQSLWSTWQPVGGAAAAEVPGTVTTADKSPDYQAGYDFGRQLQQMRNTGAVITFELVMQGIVDGMHAAADAAGGESAVPGGDANKISPASGAGVLPPARQRGFKDDYARLNAQRPGVTVLPSGVQYEVLEAGSGARPVADATVLVDYQGSLTNGVVFDSTDGADGARLKLADIAIPGLKEALLLMPAGAKWRVVIPPNMGFRNSGNNLLRRRDLIYEIKLIKTVPGP